MQWVYIPVCTTALIITYILWVKGAEVQNAPKMHYCTCNNNIKIKQITIYNKKNMNENNYIYSLRPHKDGGKIVCPNCGKKSFVPYINNDTGEILNPTCGRCDHEQSCGYHLTPAEFFKDNPEAGPIAKFEAYSKPHPSVILFGTLDEWKARQTSNETMQCDFAQGMLKFFDVDNVAQAINRYHVQSIGHNRNTAFPCINADGSVTDVMCLGYGTDLHRNDVCYHYYGDKERKEQLKAQHPNGYTYSPCYFGEHLLNENTEQNIGLVESQKTAFICSILFPQMVWLASCGCGNFNATKSYVLKDRRVFVYPDKGSSDKWGKITAAMRLNNFNVHFRPIMEELQDYGANSDIADIILDNIKKK